MPRGKLKKTKLWEFYWSAKKKWQAYWQAKEENYSKNPASFWRDTLFGMLRNTDPFKAAAIIGGTILVKQFIFNNDLFRSGIEAITSTGGVLSYTTSGIFARMLDSLLGKPSGAAVSGESVFEKGNLEGDVLLWLAAFAISYYTFTHGLDIMNVAKAFFGLGSLE